MKLKSNLLFNTSVLCRHKRPKENENIIGSNQPETLNIVAGSTLELKDEEWLKFRDAAQPMIDKGEITILVDVVKSKAALAKEKAKKVEAARKLIAEVEAKEAKEEKK